jgi:hypothetical protein
VVQDGPNQDQTPEPAQVLKFQLRRRAAAPSPRRPAGAARDADPETVDDLARYEEEDAHIDYRQRMIMNMIAVAVVTLLVGAGVWIADTIANMEKIQDCAMQGRQNCAPIEVPTLKK